jgi:hypothetical protein
VKLVQLIGLIVKKQRLRIGGSVPPLPLYSFVTSIEEETLQFLLSVALKFGKVCEILKFNMG